MMKRRKRAHDSQMIIAKENLKLGHGGPCYSQESGTSPPIKALRQSRHWVWGLAHQLRRSSILTI